MAGMSMQPSPAAHVPAPEAQRPVAGDLWRGAARKCPACGRDRLCSAYLKVAQACPACGEELHHHRADDAPPYFTIVIVGHVIVAAVLALERAVAPASWVHYVDWIPLALALSLLLLPSIKGALVGLQWANRMHGVGAGPDPGRPDAEPRRPSHPREEPTDRHHGCEWQ
jgi:uncharacterized protein (DUF983 family)